MSFGISVYPSPGFTATTSLPHYSADQVVMNHLVLIQPGKVIIHWRSMEFPNSQKKELCIHSQDHRVTLNASVCLRFDKNFLSRFLHYTFQLVPECRYLAQSIPGVNKLMKCQLTHKIILNDGTWTVLFFEGNSFTAECATFSTVSCCSQAEHVFHQVSINGKKVCVLYFYIFLWSDFQFRL